VRTAPGARLETSFPAPRDLGEIGHRERDELLGGATALLFPIEWPEPFGLVMIEALACGTPVIAWHRGSVPEVLEDGVTGFVVESIDEAVGADAKGGGLSRARCREAFEARFDACRMATDYLEAHRALPAGLRGAE